MLGILSIREQQAQRLGLDGYRRLNPLLEKCALRVAVCQSYQKGETDLSVLTGLSVSHESGKKTGESLKTRTVV